MLTLRPGAINDEMRQSGPLTGDGLRFATFYTNLHDRLLRPLLAADKPPAPPSLRNALRTIDIHIAETIDQARLLPKAA